MRRMNVIIIIAVALFLTFSFLQGIQTGEGDVLTKFFGDKDEVIMTFSGAGEDIASSQIDIYTNSTIYGATMKVEALPDNNGFHPLNVSIDVGDDSGSDWEYRFQGQGYGYMGHQSVFNDSMPQKAEVFLGPGFSQNSAIRLPKNATVTSSTITFEGGGGSAGTVTVPNVCALPGGQNGNGNNNIPFTMSSTQYRYMQFHPSSQLIGLGGGTISKIIFRSDNSFTATGSYTYTGCNIYLMHLSANTMSTTYANNYGTGRTLVYSGSLLMTWPGVFLGDVEIDVNDVFAYNGLDNLVVEISFTGRTGGLTGTGAFDATSGTTQSAGMQRLYSSSAAATSGSLGPNYGMVCKFDLLGGTPENCTLDIGNTGGAPDWNLPGSFSNEVVLPNINTQLNNILTSTSPSFIDGYGNHMVDIPLRFYSDTQGVIFVRNLSVVYTYQAIVDINPHNGNMASELNEIITDPYTGNITIPIQVKVDSKGKVRLFYLVINYDPPNFEPFGYEIPMQFIPEDSNDSAHLDLSNYFVDDRTDPMELVYTIESNNAEEFIGITIENNHFLGVSTETTPNWNSEDNYLAIVEVRATDGGGKYVVGPEIEIWVQAVNDEPLPSIVPLEPIFVDEDEKDTSIDMDLLDYFYDIEGDPLYYRVQVDPLDTVSDNNLTASLDDRTMIISIGGGLNYHGDDIPVWIYCDDDDVINTTTDGEGNYVHREVLVTVWPVNDDPLWRSNPLDPISFPEDTLWTGVLPLTDLAFDIEEDSHDLSYTLLENTQAGNIPVWIDENLELRIGQPALNFYGNGMVSIEVTDQEDSNAITDMSITVVPVNDAPEIMFTDPGEGDDVKGTIAIRGRASDIDDTHLEVSIRVDNGEWIPLEGITVWSYLFNTSEVENGMHQFDARVSDGVLNAIASLNLSVNNPLNEPPVVTISYPGDNEEVSGIFNVSGTAADPESHIVNVTIQIGSDIIWRPTSFQNVGGFWTYKWDTTTYPNENITISARSYDGAVFSSVKNITVTIANDDDAPGPTIGDPVIEDKTGSGTDWWWLIILIIIIAVVVCIVLVAFVYKNKKDREKEETVVQTAAPVATPPSLMIAAPAQPMGQTGPYAQVATTPPGAQLALGATPAYPASGPGPYGGYASTGAGGAAEIQLVPEGGQYAALSTSQVQDDTLLLPQAAVVAPPNEGTPASTVACFNCRAQIPIPIGTNILTCPICGTQGQL